MPQATCAPIKVSLMGLPHATFYLDGSGCTDPRRSDWCPGWAIPIEAKPKENKPNDEENEKHKGATTAAKARKAAITLALRPPAPPKKGYFLTHTIGHADAGDIKVNGITYKVERPMVVSVIDAIRGDTPLPVVLKRR